MSTSVGDVYVSLGVDLSGMTQELVQAEQMASGSATKIKDRLMSVGTSLADLRTQAKMVKESLAGAADFRIRGDAGLDKLHEQLAKVRAAGGVADATLDKLSLTFQENARGAHTYTQALDKIAANKGASDSVRQLATQLSNEAKEANYAAASLEKRQRVLDRMIATQSRRFASLARQAQSQGGGSTAGGGTVHGVTSIQATSAFLRTSEGRLDNNLRAAERFAANFLGLGNVFQKIFPLIGGLALGGFLVDSFQRAQALYEELKKIEAAPQRIADEFRKLNGSTQLANDELRVTNDRLANDIAKLEGRPQNGLALALDEAAVAADKLAASLHKDFEALSRLFQQENVGALKGAFVGQASTEGIKQAFLGENGYGGFEGRIQAKNDALADELETIRGKSGSGAITQKQAADQADAARVKNRAEVEAISREEIDSAKKDLQPRIAQQKQRDEYSNRTRELNSKVLSGRATESESGELRKLRMNVPDLTDQGNAIAIDQGLIRAARNRIDNIDLTAANEAGVKKKGLLEGDKSAADLTRPFADKMHELDAQIEAVNSSLSAVGKTDTAETLAKSWGAAQEAITKLNDALGKRHLPLLTEAQKASLHTAENTLALSKADLEWKTRLDQTTDSIENRIGSLKRMTDAIGKGAAATRAASIENQVAQTLGPKYNDPEFMRTHQPDVAALRQSIGAEYDTQQAQKSAQAINGLKNQIDLEKSLAAVQTQGAEAVRAVTLAYRLRDLAMQGATQSQIKAEVDLFNAQRQNQSAGNLANIDQRIDATRRLSAAQLQGAEEYRQAQLDLKYQEMQRQGSSPAEIEGTRTLDTLQHQQEVTAEALRTAMSYRDQLAAVNEQISAVDQLRAKFGDTRDLEISLKALAEQRTQILSEQALAVGSARDGMAAFFREMATQAESSAQMVHDAFRSAFGGINDELSKLMTGQKTNWASFLQSLGAQISKMGLQDLEHGIAAKIKSTLGGAGQGAPGTVQGQATQAAGHGVIATLGKIFGVGDNTLKRDGNTPATALFVTLAGANGIPQWSVPGGQQANSNLGITAADLSQLENGGSSSSATSERSAMQTLANGAAKGPGIIGELGQVASTAIKFFGDLSKPKPAAAPASSKSPDAAPGAKPGDTLTRDPSGLIIRKPQASPGATPGSPLYVTQTGANGIPQWSANGGGENSDFGITPQDLHQLEYGGDTASLSPARRSMLTLYNGAAGPKGPGVGSQLTQAAIQLAGALAMSGGSGGGGTITETFATGGRPKVGKISLVGEKGPELFIPDQPGTIIPNHKIAGYRATGGSVDPGMAYVVGERGTEAFASFASAPDKRSQQPAQNVYYTIDARGTDPVLTEQRTRSALAAVHQSAIITSVQTSAERSKRQPQR